MEDILTYLLPIVFILAYLIPKLGKKADKEAKSTQEKPKPNIFNKLNAMLEEYNQSVAEKPSGTDSRLGDEPWEVETVDAEQVTEHISEQVSKETIVEEVKSGPEIKPRKVSTKTVDLLIPSKPARFRYAQSDVSRRDLRKAIVWSEILSPPVALREK